MPKEDEQQGRCTPDKNQGSLYVRIRDIKQPFNDHEFREKVATFGDVRSINHPPGAPPEWVQLPLSYYLLLTERVSDRLIEFYDTRATTAAIDTLNNTALFGGTLEMDWAWDESTLA